ncbi:hypothetical protein QAD02_009884 [Eretmocerus hayati]|uniref:Uncharacterized protein n=1 Tax=Eretmocerus hayati TaxID=131215 RepID=A0ACC2NBF2_9HYME|nr:hypothetical protein QAD02_009884 [Eretmocerus hayati]
MSRKRKYADLEQRCRICLNDDASMSELFVDWLKPHLGDLETCSEIEIMERPNFPKNICHVCLYKLEMWNDFKLQFIATNKKLLNYFKIENVPAVKNASLLDANKILNNLPAKNAVNVAKRQKVEEPPKQVTTPAPVEDKNSTEVKSSEGVVQEKSAVENSNSQVLTNASESEELLIDDDDLATTQPQSQSSGSSSPARKSRRVEREASTKRWMERKKALIAATGEQPSESDSDNGVSLSPVQKARARVDSEIERRKKLEKALKALQTDLTEKYKVHEEDIAEQRRTRSRRNDANSQNNKTRNGAAINTIKPKDLNNTETNSRQVKQTNVETKNVSGTKSPVKSPNVKKSVDNSVKSSAELVRVQLIDIKSPVKAPKSAAESVKPQETSTKSAPVRATRSAAESVKPQETSTKSAPVKATRSAAESVKLQQSSAKSAPVKLSKDSPTTVKVQQNDSKPSSDKVSRNSADSLKVQEKDSKLSPTKVLKDSDVSVNVQQIETKSSPLKVVKNSVSSIEISLKDVESSEVASEVPPPVIEDQERSYEDTSTVPNEIEEHTQAIEDADNEMEVIDVDGDDPPLVPVSDSTLPSNQTESQGTLSNATDVIAPTPTEPVDSNAVNDATPLTNGSSKKNKKKKKPNPVKRDLPSVKELNKVNNSTDSVTDETNNPTDEADAKTGSNREVQGMKVETLKKVQMELTTFVNEEIRDRLLDNPDHPKYQAKSIKYKNACDALNNELKTILENVLRSNYEAETTPSKNSSKRKISKAFVKAAEKSSVFQPKVRVPRFAMSEETKINNLRILEGLKRERGIVGPLSRVLGKRQLKLPRKFDDFSVSLKDAFLEEQKAMAAAARNTPEKVVAPANTTQPSAEETMDISIVEPSSPPSSAPLDSSLPQPFSPRPREPSPPPPSLPDVVVLDSDSTPQESSPAQDEIAQCTSPKNDSTPPQTSTNFSLSGDVSELPDLVDLDPDAPQTEPKPNLYTSDIRIGSVTISLEPQPKSVPKDPTTPTVTPKSILKKTTPVSTKVVSSASQATAGTPKSVSMNSTKNDGTVTKGPSPMVAKLSKLVLANATSTAKTPKPVAVSTPVPNSSASKKLAAAKVTPNLNRKPIVANNSVVAAKPPTPSPKVTNNVVGSNTPTPAKRQRHICGICGEELFSKEAAEAHVKNHNVDTIPKSNSSHLANEKLVTSIPAVTAPLQKHKPKLMRCKRCQAIVEAKHVKTHVCSSVKFNCTLCDCSFGVEHLLKAHMDTHKKKAQVKAVPVVERNKHAKVTDNSHAKSPRAAPVQVNDSDDVVVEKNSRNYTCFVCDKVFVDEEQMKDHLQMHCEEATDDINEKGGFQCAFCGEKFQSEESLESHVSKHLNEDGDEKIKLMINLETQRDRRRKTYFKCDQCDETFSTPLQLAMHLPVHDEEEGGMDDDSDKEQNQLEEEVTTEHYVCSICDEMFDSQEDLSEHLDVHNGNAHVCILCEKPFSNIKDLQEHVATHL